MVSGYDKSGEEHTPPLPPLPLRSHILLAGIFLASVIVGACIA